MYCRNRPNVISNDLKCAGGWGSAPDPTGGASNAPPDPLIMSGFAPKALAPRPLRCLKAAPPSFLGTNLTLVITETKLVIANRIFAFFTSNAQVPLFRRFCQKNTVHNHIITFVLR